MITLLVGLLCLTSTAQAFVLPSGSVKKTTSSSCLFPSNSYLTGSSGSGSSSSSALFYRNHSMATPEIAPPPTLSSPVVRRNRKRRFVEENDETDSLFQLQQKKKKMNVMLMDSNTNTRTAPPPMERREVNRPNLHPLYKLEMIPLNMDLNLLTAILTVASPILLPLLPMALTWRKARWAALVEVWHAQHMAEFQQATYNYRQQQRVLVNRLIQERRVKNNSNIKKDHDDSSSQIAANQLPSVIAVTMATGQEGQGVVKALVEEAQKQLQQQNPRDDDNKRTILALCRNPDSPAARALQALDPSIVKLVQCDSTDATALRKALQPAQAVYLATTLNQANAGEWNMNWNGGDYQVAQGRAFCQAAVDLPNLQQVVYGTAPVRKWPQQFGVEPPIHYAAKWRVEELLLQAGLPMTFLRKCPYHENFTKLTETPQREQAQMGVQGGAGFDAESSRKMELPPGDYAIKAFTPDDFVYNMMDPRDAGKWAALCFEHADILIGQSLSVASDALTGPQMAQAATECGALGQNVNFRYQQQPRWLFESLAFVEPTFVYISGLQRWNCDGGQYDLDAEGVELLRELIPTTTTWCEHLEREGLGQFTETMADLLPDYTKRL